MVTLILAAGLLVAIAVAFMVYWSPAHWTMKTSVLVVLLVMGMVSYELYKQQLGRPIHARPDGNFVYVYHIIMGEPADIILWTLDEDRNHKLYQYPFTRKDGMMLEQAKEKSEQGVPQQLEYGEDNGEGPGLSDFPIPDENYVKD